MFKYSIIDVVETTILQSKKRYSSITILNVSFSDLNSDDDFVFAEDEKIVAKLRLRMKVKQLCDTNNYSSTLIGIDLTGINSFRMIFHH